MAVSRGQRLRKAAAKAVKRKQTVEQKKAAERRELAVSKPRHIDFPNAPLRACLISANAFENGVATLLVARDLAHGRVGMAAFLIDVWCQGVKDAFFRVETALDFEDYVDNLEDLTPLEEIDPSRARKLLRGAVEYAASLGIPPSDAFAEIEPIFGDVALADETFAYGRDGKPFYAPGVNDSPARRRRVLAALEAKVGADGFDYLLDLDFDDQPEFDDEEEEPGLEPPQDGSAA